MADENRAASLAAYGLLAVAVAVLQTTLFARLHILGTIPLMTYAATVCVAMFEGEQTGALFGLLTGYCIDVTASAVFGRTALILMLAGYAAGYLARTLILQSLTSAASLYGLAHGLVIAGDLLLRLLVTFSLAGFGGAALAQLRLAAVSLPYLPLFYLIVRRLGRAFGRPEYGVTP
ncbi:MAG: hypothetical protein GXX99_04575 [Clostridiales bacterium]|nr:hypothetical protein [Clostridiales bacterium]